MNYNFKDIIDMIRNANNRELIIISLFVLPILLSAWLVFLNTLDFLDQYNGWKFLLICLLSTLYIGGLIYMKKAGIEEDNLKRAKMHIETRLKKRGGNRASFDAIREIVNKKYSDDFLEKLIDMYPKTFGACVIRKENKKGITLVTVEAATKILIGGEK